MTQIVLGIVTAILTIGLYSALRVSWPRLYYGPDDAMEAFISASFWKYVAFRSLPIVAIVGAATGFASRSIGQDLWVIGFVYVIAYPTLSAALLYNGRRKNGRKIDSVDRDWMLLSTAIIAGGALGGHLVSPLFERILPPTGTLSESVVTAVFVGTLVALLRGLQLDKLQFDEVIESNAKKLHTDLDLLELQATEARVQAAPLQAILVAESLQRPPWFQRLERLAPRFGEPRTMGPFQQRTNKAITKEFTKNSGLGLQEYLNDNPAISSILGERFEAKSAGISGESRVIYALHNPSKKFVRLCERTEPLFLPTNLPNFVDLPESSMWIMASDIIVSNGLVSIWFNVPRALSEGEYVTIKPPNSGDLLTWGTPDDGAALTRAPEASQRHSAPPNQFFDEWAISYVANNEAESVSISTKTLVFRIQDHIPASPRWA